VVGVLIGYKICALDFQRQSKMNAKFVERIAAVCRKSFGRCDLVLCCFCGIAGMSAVVLINEVLLYLLAECWLVALILISWERAKAI
jgi:hypothetical protein